REYDRCEIDAHSGGAAAAGVYLARGVETLAPVLLADPVIDTAKVETASWCRNAECQRGKHDRAFAFRTAGGLRRELRIDTVQRLENLQGFAALAQLQFGAEQSEHARAVAQHRTMPDVELQGRAAAHCIEHALHFRLLFRWHAADEATEVIADID